MSMDDLSHPTLTQMAPVDAVPETPAEAPIAAIEDAPVEDIAVEDIAAGHVTLGRQELATQLVAKLCHDFISPAGAIMSGLDLLEDPTAQDMKTEALNLIATSAKKLVTLVHFARVAYGAATTSEAFSGKELHKILADIYSTMRAELDFDIMPDVLFSKPAARALVNLGLITGNALPTGGMAHIESRRDGDSIWFTATAKGPRARLKSEAIEGLSGKPLSDGLSGQWIQPHWLYSVVAEAGGTLEFISEPEMLTFTIRMPV